MDIRNRVVAAIEAGITRRVAAARFGVLGATAVHWHRRFREAVCRSHPPDHWKTFTVVVALCPVRIIDHMIFDGAMTGERFRIRMDALAKRLRPGNFVIRDNLTAHKISGLREILQKERCGYPLSAVLQSGTQSLRKSHLTTQTYLGKIGARTVDDLHSAVKEAANRVAATRARNHSISCGV